MGYTYSPYRQWRIIKKMGREWKRINKEELRRQINELYRSKLIEKRENPDGSTTIILTERGKLRALKYRFGDMKIKTDSWDNKWRMVAFDIPERTKRGRDALRKKLKELGFYELQKSLWVFPYECRSEIDFIIEYFGLRRYVRFAILEFIDNELHLKEIFKLK